MAFKDIFKNENDINEKSIIGFASFVMMCLFGVADIALGIAGSALAINEVIYNSFVIVTLGSFGIAEAGKIFGKSKKEE